MVRVDTGYTHGAGVKHARVTHHRRCLVSMYDRDAFSNHDLTKHGEIKKVGRKCNGITHDKCRQVVHFESIRHPSYTTTVVVLACQDDDFMPLAEQTLRQGPYVHFNSTKTWVEKIRHHKNCMLF